MTQQFSKAFASGLETAPHLEEMALALVTQLAHFQKHDREQLINLGQLAQYQRSSPVETAR